MYFCVKINTKKRILIQINIRNKKNVIRNNYMLIIQIKNKINKYNFQIIINNTILNRINNKIIMNKTKMKTI